MQDVPSQYGKAFGGAAVQTAHDGPHAVGSLLATHVPLHAWYPYPASQRTPQDVPSQVAEPYGGTGHGVQELPQFQTL